MAAVLLWISPNYAHRLAGMQVGRYLRLDVETSRISGRYNVNFENVPAFGERKWMDRDQDGQISEEEGVSYADSLLPELQDSAKFELDGRPLKVTLTNGKIVLGKKTIIPEPFQVIFDMEVGPVELDGVHRLDFWDTIYAEDAPPKVLVQTRGDLQVLKQWHVEKRIFWDRGGTSAVLDAPFSLVIGPETSKNRIRSALLSTPRFGAAADVDADTRPSGPSLPLLVLALGLAGFLGAMRGVEMTTGSAHNGKTRYTMAVLALGVLALCITHYLLPERTIPWTGGVSGLLTAGIGVWMLVRGPAAHTHGASEVHTHTARHGSSGALAVLLVSVALNRLFAGLGLFAIFGLGLAVTAALRRSAGARLQPPPRALSLIGGAALAILGFAVALRALMAGGILVVNL